MGNQAQRKRELELWEITNASKDRNMRLVRQNSVGRKGYGASSHGKTRSTRTPDRRSLSVNLPEHMQGRQRMSSNTTRRNPQGTPRRSAAAGTPRQDIQRQPAMAAGGRKRMSKNQRARRRRVRRRRRVAALLLLTLAVGIFLAGKSLWQRLDMEVRAQSAGGRQAGEVQDMAAMAGKEPAGPVIREDFLSISEYNRPGTELSAVNNIFVHYTANPRTSAAQNRSYFENLAQTHERAASAHFIIGYDGEIIQCIPLEEEAYAVIGRNHDSISIECCYISKDGAFTQETYDALVYMLAMLIERYDLDAQDILRHYDCGGKLCPLYYVEHEDAWRKLLSDVEQYRQEAGEALAE